MRISEYRRSISLARIGKAMVVLLLEDRAQSNDFTGRWHSRRRVDVGEIRARRERPCQTNAACRSRSAPDPSCPEPGEFFSRRSTSWTCTSHAAGRTRKAANGPPVAAGIRAVTAVSPDTHLTIPRSTNPHPTERSQSSMRRRPDDRRPHRSSWPAAVPPTPGRNHAGIRSVRTHRPV